MSTAATLAWVLGVALVIAMAGFVIVLGCYDDIKRELQRTRALAAVRLIEAERASLYTRCADTGPDRYACSLPAGHPGDHWAFSARMLAAEWSDEPASPLSP